MLAALMLIVSTSIVYSGPPLDTPAGVATCIQRQVENLSSSNEADTAIAGKALAACEEPFELLLAARDAAVAKEAGSPVPEWNRAHWREAMTRHFEETALLYVERARRPR